MADKEININFKINTDNGAEKLNKQVKDLKDTVEGTTNATKSLKQQYKELQAQMDSLDVNSEEYAKAAKLAGELKEKMDATANSTKSLKQQYRELQAQMSTLDVNSKEFAIAAERAGKLKDQMNDTADAIKGNTGPAIEGMNNTFGIMKGQLENLDFGGLGQSLKTLGQNASRVSFKMIKEEIGGLVKGLGELALAVVTNPFLLIASVLAAIAMNWKEVSAWMNQTTIQAQALKEATTELNTEYKNQLTSQGKNIAQIEMLTDTVSNHNKTEKERKDALKALQVLYPEQFANQQIDINNTNLLTQAKEQLISTIKQEAKAKAAQALLEKEYANQMALSAEDQANRAKVSAEDYQEAVSTYAYNSETLFKETNQAISEWGNSTTAGFGKTAQELSKSNSKIAYLEGLAGDAIVKSAEDTANEKLKVEQTNQENLAKERAAGYERQRQERIAFEQQLRNEINKTIMSDDEYEMEMLRQQYQAKLAEAKKNGTDKFLVEEWYNSQIITLLEKQNEKEVNDEKAKNEKLKASRNQANLDRIKSEDDYFNAYTDLMGSEEDKEIQATLSKYETLIALAEQNGQETQAIVDAQQAAVTAIHKKYLDEQIKNDSDASEKQKLNALAVEKAKFDMISTGIETISDLYQAFASQNEESAKKAFKVNKAASMAQATIDTYSAINGIFKTASASPETILFPGYPYVQAALIGAAGLANVAKIAKQQFNGGSSSGGGASPNVGGGASTSVSNASQPAIPSMSLFGQGNNMNNVGGTQTVNRDNQQNTNITVKISETEITNTQNFVKKVRETSVL